MKNAEHRGVYLKLNTQVDEDIITRLDEQKNKQGYIKELIRIDMALDVFRNGVQNGVIKVVQDGQCDNNETEG